MPQLALVDGRIVGYGECGPVDGAVVFAFHGTPGSGAAMTTKTIAAAAAATHTRIVAPERPGFGHSSAERGHLLREWPIVVARLADDLGIGKFSVLGVSGGGPYAAACAALLPDRVRSAAIVSGIGPLSETADPMTAINRVQTKLAALPVNAARPLSAVMCLAMRKWPEASIRSAMKSVPACDADIMRRPEVFGDLVEDARTSPPTMAAGMADDYANFAKPWQFRLEDIRVPVHVWHGDLDQNVPFQHGRDQASRIPGAVFHECPGEGHLLIIDHLAEILGELR